MVKSGLILGIVALLLTAGIVLISPLCSPCLVIFLGLGAGYLAGVFDKPLTNGATAKSGAIAGVIGGVGSLLGQIIGGAINGAIVGPEGAADILRQFDMGGSAMDPTTYWGVLVGTACCIGILNIALMAGLGALGGILWWQITGKKNAATPQMPSY